MPGNCRTIIFDFYCHPCPGRVQIYGNTKRCFRKNKNIRTAEMKKEITKMSELENKAMEINENEMNEASGGAYKPLP